MTNESIALHLIRLVEYPKQITLSVLFCSEHQNYQSEL